ncbi:Multidrug resistance protein MdtH [Peribacillus sp. Bi96]|uniref:MFS transporter n=1 Tax=unclassified Peribacillus TaxID=2675266 RepID=UPI001D9361B3|nr:MFS transporter [Peribacillus sp. Bi96]CAH0233893.1 Multidrug resistance protein MdtH [Peribacillus sp. Bi96]
MTFKHVFISWKYPSILLCGIGISNFGAWVYFIALNLIILDMTNSALAVAGLYIVKPMASLFTNVWAGSVIDRINKRNLMVALDLFRTVFLALLPTISSIWVIYSVVFVINMAGTMFVTTSRSYITKLIPVEQRKRFNSLRSLIDSGAFLIGPAIAGILFLIGTPVLAIYMNAAALLLSGIITLFMPNLEKGHSFEQSDRYLSWTIMKKDWGIVLNFSRKFSYIMLIYFFFSCMVVMETAIDSQEAAFAKAVLLLSDSDYGFLVSIAGAGIIAGAIVNAVSISKVQISYLIGLGSLFVSIGYMIFAFSTSFTIAAIGFFIIAFSLAFANTGFQTFYQNNIPVEIMGRVGSIFGLLEALLIIMTTAIVGISAHFISIRFVVISGSVIMFALSILLSMLSMKTSKSRYYHIGNVEANAEEKR